MKEPKRKPKLEHWQVEYAARLRLLWKNYRASGGLTQEAFGAEHDIGVQGMVHQYIKPLTPLNLPAAIKFARGLNCKIADFSPTLAGLVLSALPHATKDGPVYAEGPMERDILLIVKRLKTDKQDQILGNVNRLMNEQGLGMADPGLRAAKPTSSKPKRPLKKAPSTTKKLPRNHNTGKQQ